MESHSDAKFSAITTSSIYKVLQMSHRDRVKTARSHSAILMLARMVGS